MQHFLVRINLKTSFTLSDICSIISLMNNQELERDRLLDGQAAADISYHIIHWSNSPVERIPTGGNLNFHSCPPSGTMLHRHDFGEIVFILKDTVKHTVNGEGCILKAGHVCFIRPDDAHFFSKADTNSVEIIIFAYNLELFLSLSKYLEDDSFLKRLTKPVLPPLFKMESPKFTELCNRMLSINSSIIHPSVKMVNIKILIAELFTHFFIDENNLLKETAVPPWLEQLCDQMRSPNNFKKGLKQMHHLACCTKEHLCKSFRKYLNKTPTEFINELKMSHAARLLTDTNEEIYAIAYDLNIHSLSRFYFLFKKYYKLSPAKYRIRAKKGVGIL